MKNTESFRSYQKSPYRSIKHTTYFDAYDDLLSKYRGKSITFIEIGVLGGGSLFMWRDFFGDRARIIGIDLNPNAKKWEKDGFEIFIGSQSDEKFWDKLIDEVGTIDVVLDDGGHTYEQQVITTERLLPQINDGGVLIVEDTHTSYMPGFGNQKYSFIEYVKLMVDRINHRFGAFDSDISEGRVWSVQVYESIVAFKINTTATALASKPTDNGGANDFAEDLRYTDDTAIRNIKLTIQKFSFLKHLPGSRTIYRAVLSLLASRSAKRYRKYFKRAAKLRV